MTLALELVGIGKSFTMHLQGGIRLSVVADVTFAVSRGECVVLAGPSGVGKSSLLKMIFGSYRCDRGRILVQRGAQQIDVAAAEPLVAGGTPRDLARREAAELLRRLNIAGSLWGLPPATFSGGEQQRVNIARGFLPNFPILLLDEPTASLDARNCEVVVELIAERKRRGAAIVAIVHDQAVRDRIADDVIDMTRFAAAA